MLNSSLCILHLVRKPRSEFRVSHCPMGKCGACAFIKSTTSHLWKSCTLTPRLYSHTELYRRVQFPPTHTPMSEGQSLQVIVYRDLSYRSGYFHRQTDYIVTSFESSTAGKAGSEHKVALDLDSKSGSLVVLKLYTLASNFHSYKSRKKKLS